MFHEGKLDEYKRWSAPAMEIVRTKDAGTLQYDTGADPDPASVEGAAASGSLNGVSLTEGR